MGYVRQYLRREKHENQLDMQTNQRRDSITISMIEIPTMLQRDPMKMHFDSMILIMVIV